MSQDTMQQTETATVQIRYRLSAAGQRVALFAGRHFAQEQVVSLTAAEAGDLWPDAVSISTPHADGTATIDLTQQCEQVWDGEGYIPVTDGPRYSADYGYPQTRPRTYNWPMTAIDLLEDELRRMRAADAAIAESRERRAAEKRAKIEAARVAPIEDLVAYDQYQSVGMRWHARKIAEEAGRLSEAEAEAERRNGEEAAAAEREKAAKAEREAQRRAEREAWIREHGSRRLQRLLAEGIEHEAVYRDERLALERPGWRYDLPPLPGSASEPRNAPEAALDLLDEARQTAPDARLVYWTAERESEDEYGDTETEVVRGYTCRAEFLGREIVYRVDDDGIPPVVVD